MTLVFLISLTARASLSPISSNCWSHLIWYATRCSRYNQTTAICDNLLLSASPSLNSSKWLKSSEIRVQSHLPTSALNDAHRDAKDIKGINWLVRQRRRTYATSGSDYQTMGLKLCNVVIEKQKNGVIDIGRFTSVCRCYARIWEGNLQSHVTKDCGLGRSETRIFSSYLSLSTTLGNSNGWNPVRPTHNTRKSTARILTFSPSQSAQLTVLKIGE